MGLRIGFLIILLATLSACDTKSTIQFSGDRALPTVNTVPAAVNPGMEPTQGGYFKGQTASSYQTTLSLGAKTSSIQGTTGSGYKVQMNIQGQMAQ